eukprot:5443105-Amphidinium_carterae.1
MDPVNQNEALKKQGIDNSQHLSQSHNMTCLATMSEHPYVQDAIPSLFLGGLLMCAHAFELFRNIGPLATLEKKRCHMGQVVK